MRRFAGALLIMAVFAGCQTPGDPRLGAVGRTVPPPATGSFGAPDAYYNRRPAGAAPAGAAAPKTGLGYDDSNSLDGGWRASGTAAQMADNRDRTQRASFDAPV